MRKDVVVLSMVFIAGLLLGVFLTGGVMGSMMWMKAERYQLELREAEDVARMEAERARAIAEQAVREAGVAAEKARQEKKQDAEAAKEPKP